ncbi:MAG TPA: amidase [Burkholderiales bacterium]|jgi:aspartyl-tRNA(Asn)/glutamyl-tRNA(Gln) amidotransferase subunit A
MNRDEILALSCAQLAAAIRERRTSGVAAMEAVLERARAMQPKLNCFLRIDEAQALEAARQADRQPARGPLHGVPMAHKDMYYREGVASSGGSRILRERPAPATATALERLDAAGAIQFGVLNMTEFALGPTGHNWHYGHCRNPWNPERITGGSSSGTAASVAARANFAGLGSDTGGSIRLPAALCGTSAIKPTYARVSRAGAMPLSHSLDTVGPLTRTVEDAALIAQVISGPDPRDPTCDSRPVPDWMTQLENPIRGMRVGRPGQHFYDECAPEIAAAMESSLEVFSRLGASIVEVDMPDLGAYSAAAVLISTAEAATLHREWLRTRADDYSDQVRGRLLQGLAIPATAYIDALRMRGAALAEFCAQVFTKVDVLHAPVLGIPTPTIAETELGWSERTAAVLARITRLTRPASYLGLPTVCANAGFTRDGMPIGLQLVARPFDEATALRAGHAFQRITDWHLHRPQL